ncbi:proliferation marker protein Ki-67 isoform X2 [Silurus asotus]|uniref:Proliferation marker protein Ki-67 isoform X2 n=1 Tax=Silurus asotus TaxID=30991 RepID=A0AAD5AP12_SILAS|nr:proliferation marker protein Ki-67 isoform X2 [Silurus asotus]
MPLLGKIVVIKRNGTDGTEFPLTASCLFGRKLDCDIRIQLPQVSKEHCRIEFNENKELILTNLSSVNPTLINGTILQQSERLKHGDLITIIDRSFRFEYPPAPTPKKKRLSTPGKGEAVKVLKDQQVKRTPGTTEKKKSENATDTCLKDGSNLPAPLDQSVGGQENKASTDSTLSPFSDLYNMVKQDLVTKPAWKSTSFSDTPLSRPPAEKQEVEKVSHENEKPVTPKSTQKKRRSSAAKLVDDAQTENLSAQVNTATPEGVGTRGSQKNTPQKFTPGQVAQQIVFESPKTKSPRTRRSSASQTPENQTTSPNLSEPADAEEASAKQVTRTSPRTNAGKRLQAQDVLQEVVATPTSDNKAGDGKASSKKHKCDDLHLPAAKRKRVSFGGQLSPELFDKRLPPNSPLRRGATPGRRSLGFTQKSQFLLRRASTIGLMGYQLDEDIAESPVRNASPKPLASPVKTPKTPKTPSPAKTPKSPKTPSPAKTPKTPSPAKTPKTPKTPSPAKTPKTPSPAKTPKTPSPAKTPKTPKSPSTAKIPKTATTPKTPKSPSSAKTPSSVKKSSSPKAKTRQLSSTPPSSSNQSTPKSSKRSSLSVKSPSMSEASLLKTPTMHGRFSVSRISTPSPIPVQEKEESVLVDQPRECVTPRATARRNSMKASARKTPKSVMKSARDVVRSRRSGASRANLKVVSSWADIVKFGQAKPQTEGGTKKTASKKAAVKQTKVAKPKTPAHRLKDLTSTGHADSPASIVVGKAYLRPTQRVGAAPKVVCNVALFKKDMKMDEDFTGVSDIFKTPANRRKSAFTRTNQCPASPPGVAEMTETSIMNTPEESGEMVVSPMSLASTAKPGRYNSEAVTRLLQGNQDGSLIEEMDISAAHYSSPSMPSEDQTKNKKVVPTRTPRQKPAPTECLTGVKRLMRTPKQKPEPIEDLRGKLLKTPKEPKLPQEESLEGVQELFKTPKRTETSLEVKNSPVVCAVRLQRLDKTEKNKQEEDLTGVKRLMKTPKQKKQVIEEDLTGIQQMMKTPKLRRQPLEEDLTGVKQMMKTPKQKKRAVDEDLTGIKQMLKTPKLKKQPVEEDLTGIEQLMKTPKLSKQLVGEDPTGVQQKIETPKQKKQPVEEDLTGVKQQVKTPKQKKQPVEEDLTGIQQKIETPKQKKQPVKEDLTGAQQQMKTPKQKNQLVEDLVGVKRLLQTPKEKGEPVENDFGIDHLMKSPKQKNDELLGSTVVCGVFSVEDTSEEKENICPAEDVKKNAQAAVVLQIEAEEAKNSYQEMDLVTSHEAMVVCTSEIMSMAVESTPSAGFQQEEQCHRSPPAKKTRRGAQVRTTQKSQKSQEHLVDSDSLSATVSGTEEEPSVDSATSVPSVRARRGKSFVELLKDAPVQSPARKSSRGRIAKERVEVQKSSQSSSEDEQAALKPRRGRNAGQNVQVLLVADLKASAEAVLTVSSPAPRARRGIKNKHESEKPHEPETLPKTSVEEVAVASESSELQQSAEIEAPAKSNTRARRGRTTRKEPSPVAEVEEIFEIQIQDVVVETEAVVPESSAAESQKSTTKSRRGRPAKKEMLKAPLIEESLEPSTVVVESDDKSSCIVAVDVVEPQVPASAEVQLGELSNLKTRRGRMTKKETPVEETSNPAPDSEVMPEEPVVKPRRGRKVALNNQAVFDKSNVQPHAVESEAKPEAPAVRSGRGARNKRDAANGPAPESIATVAVIEEPAEEPVVKTVRGGKRTKQPKAQVLNEPQDEEQNKTGVDSEENAQHSEAPEEKPVRGKRTAAVKAEAEAPVKRGRHAASAKAPPPVVKPSRGRNAAAKSQPELAEKDVVEPVNNETKVAESISKETDSDGPSSKAVPKRGRGKPIKKAVLPTKDTSVDEDKEEPELQKSKTKEKPESKDDAEAKQQSHPAVRGRKARGAKKLEEPEPEAPVAEENVQPVRRGRAAPSVVSQNVEGPKRGQKRKVVEDVTEETQDTESLPKRKRGRGAGAEGPTNEAAPAKGGRTATKEAEETPEVEAKAVAPKKEDKPVRGRRKTAPEDVPAQDPVSETSARRGTRGQKKAETDVPPAPVRRTRRK